MSRSKKSNARRTPGSSVWPKIRCSGIAGSAQAHHDVDARDLKSFGRRRKLVDQQFRARDIEQVAVAFDVEVMVLGGVRVEVSLRSVDGNFAKQTDLQ